MCFHIVTAASLERSEVRVQCGAQDRGPIYVLMDAFNFVSWSSTEPPNTTISSVSAASLFSEGRA